MKSPGPAEAQSKHMTQTNENIFTNSTNHLMEKIVESINLRKALKRVEDNKGAPGVDKMEVKVLRKYLHLHWPRIERQLLEGTYRPSPVRRIEIPKPDGGVRQLGIPTVLDRLIQQAIQQVLTPIFEKTFSDFSYGFRPERSARQAVKKAQEFIQAGKQIVVDMDLEKFFDRVNHDVLMMKIVKHVEDKRIHKLIRRYLQAGVMINGCCVTTEEGTPQGGPMSPLLANIMLTDLDTELTQRGHSFVRYADDCNIYVASRRAGERVYKSIKSFIDKRLKLKVNEQKSAVGAPSRRKFLGFSFTIGKEVKLRIAPKTVDRFKERIRKLTRRNLGISLESRLKRLNMYLNGWSGYFGIAQAKAIFPKLDKWIRRRLRACVLRQWKLGKTKRANLINMGLSKVEASCIAYSRKGLWRLSHTRQISKVMGVNYWKSQGLVTLAERNEELLLRVSS